MSNKQQVVVVGGGETFDTREEYLEWLKTQMRFEPFKYATRKKNWKENLESDLNGWFGKKYEVAYLSMPNKLNAKYEEWKIYFERIVPHLRKDYILVGHSLGGQFITKYLGEYDGPVPKAVLYVSSPIVFCWEPGFADFGIDLGAYKHHGFEVHVFHSTDDVIVPIENSLADGLRKYNKKTKFHIFEDRGHFIYDEHFPELVRVIKGLSK